MTRITLFFATLLMCSPAFAGNSVSITEVWIAEAPPVSKVHAGYFIIKNAQASAVSLTGVSSKSYRKIELHRSLEKDGVATMEAQDTVTIAAGDKLVFEPGGYHLMLFDPAKPYESGDTLDLSFKLDNGETLTVEAVIKKRATMKSDEHHHHHHHHHH